VASQQTEEILLPPNSVEQLHGKVSVLLLVAGCFSPVLLKGHDLLVSWTLALYGPDQVFQTPVALSPLN
jgi:hypothetical protein